MYARSVSWSVSAFDRSWCLLASIIRFFGSRCGGMKAEPATKTGRSFRSASEAPGQVRSRPQEGLGFVAFTQNKCVGPRRDRIALGQRADCFHDVPLGGADAHTATVTVRIRESERGFPAETHRLYHLQGSGCQDRPRAAPKMSWACESACSQAFLDGSAYATKKNRMISRAAVWLGAYPHSARSSVPGCGS